MKRKNATRNALFTSVVSLLLCVSMLVGTTFAWFTDTVESGVNVINAGNLDVELYHDNGAEKVDGQTDLFNLDEVEDQHDLWEPGAVAYENFIVKNEGNLALKYQLALNFTNATKNSKGRTLADVLKVAVVEGGFNGTREDAKALDFNKSLSTFTLNGDLKEHNDNDTYGIVIYWEPSDNDNDYNMKNVEKNSDGSAVNALKIDLGVSLFATQLTHEDDSFDNTYDEDASLTIPEIKVETPTVDAFMDALAAGENAVLTSDLEWSDGDFTIPEGVTSAIDLNGNTLTIGSGSSIIADGNLIINGGTVDIQPLENALATPIVVSEGATMQLGKDVVVNVPSSETGIVACGTLIVDGATINVAENGMGIYVAFDPTGNGNDNITDIVIKSGSIMGAGNGIEIDSGYIANVEIGKGASVNNIKVRSGATLNLTYYGSKPTVAADSGSTVNYYYEVAGYEGLITDGTTNYYVYNAQGLKSLNNWVNMWNSYGNTFNIMADIDATGFTWNTKQVSPNGDNTPGLIFNGNGNTISNLTIAGGGLFTLTTNGTYATQPTTFKDITFDNVTVTGDYHVGVVWGQVAGDLVLENVHVKNSNIIGTYNVGGLVGSSGEFAIDASVKYVNCSVTNTTLTANGAAGGDPTGASAFMGRALGKTYLVFEGNNVAENITYVNENGLVGGGIYGYTIWANGGFTGTGICDSFTNWNGLTAASDTDALKEALTNGGNIALTGTVDLGGKTGNCLALTNNTTITGGAIKGTGWTGELNYAANATSGNIVFDGVTFDTTDWTTDGWAKWGISVNINGTANVTFKNCNFKGTQCPIYLSGSEAVVTLENCTFESTVGAIQCEVYSGDFQLGQDLIIKNCDFTGMVDVLHIYDYDKDPSSEAIAQYLTDNGNTFTGTCMQTCN